MKKMTFALACASTAALFAAPIHQATFEDYSKGFSGLSGKDDAGSNSTSVYWTYLGSGSDDGSSVKAYKGVDDPDNLDKPAGTQLSGEIGDKYLELSTEGGTLWRSVNEATDTVLGAEKAVDATKGLYIDTMVQFTPTEDGGAPETSADDKIAIWLDVDAENNKTNLCVKASKVSRSGADIVTPTTFVLNADVQAGAWYRLTIKAIKDVTKSIADGEKSTGITGFQIYLDGNLLSTTDTVFEDSYTNWAYDDWLEDADEALLKSGTVFASLDGFKTAAGATIQAVGFKGSGALDDLTITEENPIKEEPAPEGDIAFTITTADGVTASWSTTADGEFTTYAAGAKAPAGTIYVKLTTADGGMKIVEQTVSADDGASNAYDLSAETFGWAEYLGAAVDGAFVIDDAAELKMFAEKAVELKTTSVTFKLGADITLTETWPGVGSPNAKGVLSDGSNIAGFTAGAFCGVFDGQNHTIKGVKLAKTYGSDAKANQYAGFFNGADGATIKNLNIAVGGYKGFDATSSDTTKFGGGVFVGVSRNTTIEDCATVVDGANDTFQAQHCAGGIVGYASKGTILKNCTNNLKVVAVQNEKAGGLVACAQDAAKESGGITLESCSNLGDVTGPASSAFVGGLVSYADSKVTLKGTCTVNCAVSGKGAYSIVAFNGGSGEVADGAEIKAMAGMKSIANNKIVDGLMFATVEGSVATFVKESAIKSGDSLKAMAPGGTVTLANIGDAITLDMTLATATVETSAANATVQQAGNVYTVVSAKPPYPEYIGDDAAKQAKYDAWATANNIAAADFSDAAKANQKAYLLNVAPGKAAEDAEKAFKIKSITVDATGKVTVVGPEGKFNGTVEIQGAATLAGPWAAKADNAGQKFFKAVLK